MSGLLCLPVQAFAFLQREQLVLQDSFGGGFAAAGAAASVNTTKFKSGIVDGYSV
jgi:hypothetical protein